MKMMRPGIICTILLLLMMAACTHEPVTVPEIGPAGISVCKRGGEKSGDSVARDQDCLQYRWVDGDTLILKHINAAFNCCPEGVDVTLKVSGDTLMVTEQERSALCDCNCLYDLGYRISGIGLAKWHISVKEQYVQPAERALSFEINLEESTAGEQCITRSGYPWGL
jgi:hypothetical protein